MMLPVFYFSFQAKANLVKSDFLSFLIEVRRAGKTVAGYGAAAKDDALVLALCAGMALFWSNKGWLE